MYRDATYKSRRFEQRTFFGKFRCPDELPERYKEVYLWRQYSSNHPTNPSPDDLPRWLFGTGNIWMEHGPGTEGNGRDTTRRNADPGATAIDVVALVHWNEMRWRWTKWDLRGRMVNQYGRGTQK